MLPIIADRNTPITPLLFPTMFDIISGLNIARVIPTIRIIPKNCGSMPSMDFQPFNNAFLVFSLSFF